MHGKLFNHTSQLPKTISMRHQTSIPESSLFGCGFGLNLCFIMLLMKIFASGLAIFTRFLLLSYVYYFIDFSLAYTVSIILSLHQEFTIIMLTKEHNQWRSKICLFSRIKLKAGRKLTWSESRFERSAGTLVHHTSHHFFALAFLVFSCSLRQAVVRETFANLWEDV